MEVIGFEPTASWLQTRRSARLSYTPRSGSSLFPNPMIGGLQQRRGGPGAYLVYI